MKPMLASDFDETKVQYPVYLQPKVDGVRGAFLNQGFTGRSLKVHKNKALTAFYSQPEFKGLDGELFVGDNPAAPDLCRKTSSVCSTVNSKEVPSYMVFDLIEDTPAPYKVRLESARDRVKELNKKFPDYNIQLVRSVHVGTKALLDHYEAEWLAEGFEGVIIRSPNGAYKEGRSTVKEGGLLRIKRFTDAEALVWAITEGTINNNAATTNELGRTERSSHQENLVPNGMVGNLLCKDLVSGLNITVSPGNMDHATRKHYFDNQGEIVGKVVKFKSFMHGVKDKPRFPTFVCLRDAADMS